jgi:hypothetical protein
MRVALRTHCKMIMCKQEEARVFLEPYGFLFIIIRSIVSTTFFPQRRRITSICLIWYRAKNLNETDELTNLELVIAGIESSVYVFISSK